MISIKSILENFEKHYLRYTLLIYGLGMLHEVLYYALFNIPIIYYITLPDVLLLTIQTLFLIVFITLFIYFIYLWPFRVLQEYLVKWNLKKLYINIIDFALIVIIIGSQLFLFFTYKDFLGSYKLLALLAFYTMISTVFMSLLIFPDYEDEETKKIKIEKVWTKQELEELKISNRTGDWIGVLVMIGFLIMISWYSSRTSISDKNNISHIAFCDGDNYQINTAVMPDLFYIGETSTNVFIYDKSTNITTVYSKAELKNLQYKKQLNLFGKYR